MIRRPSRHDLLQLTPAGWSALFAADPALAGLEGVRIWRERNLPVMTRRSQPGDIAGAVPVCIALPPALGRLRLSFCVEPDSVARTLPPVRPVDLGDDPSLPTGWAPRLRAVTALGDRMSLQPSLFGSLLWQHVSGMPFLRDGSDLDLFWRFGPGERHRIEPLLPALAALDAEPGPRLDGEIHVAGRGAVSWRELASRPVELLLRTDTEARLVRRDWFLDRIRVAC